MTTLGRIGFGTYRLKGETLRDALTHAFAVGYRSIDTAQVYKNEADVGAFLQSQFDAGGITRTDVFITTKIAPANQGTEKLTTPYSSPSEN
ncbi:NADP-dependent oxidoreductase domain-containing protein [Chytridium lagenaria]|nr:NADP-dependent oxidoreductase domain-containing protein [Chytridium lagenaria]